MSATLGTIVSLILIVGFIGLAIYGLTHGAAKCADCQNKDFCHGNCKSCKNCTAPSGSYYDPDIGEIHIKKAQSL